MSVHQMSRVCGDYIRRVLDWQLDLLDHAQLHTITVYTLLQLLTVHYNTCRFFLQLQLTLTTESLQGPGPPADPIGSHWSSTNSSGLFSATHRQKTRNWSCPYNCTDCRLTSELYSPWTGHKKTPISLLLYDVITGTDPKENTSSSDCCVALATVINKRLHCWLLTLSYCLLACLLAWLLAYSCRSQYIEMVFVYRVSFKTHSGRFFNFTRISGDSKLTDSSRASLSETKLPTVTNIASIICLDEHTELRTKKWDKGTLHNTK
jgi:hypothetical protein